MTDHSITELPKIGIVGVSGRMGQMLVNTVMADSSVQLGGATEHHNHNWVGSRLDAHFSQLNSEIEVHDTPDVAFSDVDVIIDFSTPSTTLANAEFAASIGIVHVVGTTGFAEQELRKLSNAAKSAIIIRAGNMSLGINLLVGLTEQVARALGSNFDIEIVEHHHRHKVDAPSGTALMLGDAAAKGRGVSTNTSFERGRDGITGPRTKDKIGFSAIRGGDVVGEHDVIFAGLGERIHLRHVATDRSIYARGAISAARWGLIQDYGEYDMNDVLGLKQHHD